MSREEHIRHGDDITGPWAEVTAVTGTALSETGEPLAATDWIRGWKGRPSEVRVLLMNHTAFGDAPIGVHIRHPWRSRPGEANMFAGAVHLSYREAEALRNGLTRALAEVGVPDDPA